MSATLRQELLARLRQGPVGLRELARDLGLREREVADHLVHAVRSLAPGERLGEEPAACLACGFSFRKRERFAAPGRCPRCRAERIRPATFWIESP
jgi:predicted Zn-ribbon and HTH transcriptional regulator